MSPGSNKLDRRPTSVLVSGFEQEEKEEIVKHFTKFGEIADSAEDEVDAALSYYIVYLLTNISADSFDNLQIQVKASS